MKRFFPFIAALLAPALTAAELPETTVRFINGDHLSGTISELTPERLVLDAAPLARPAPFPLAGVLDADLTAETPESDVRHEATVSLTNGDAVTGQLAGLSDDKVLLDTWFAGRLELNRRMISEVRISERPDFLYRGPTSIDGWKFSGGEPAWTYRGGALRSSSPGGIARDVKLPEKCSIAFTAEWRNSLTLDLLFFIDAASKERPENGYEMKFQNRSIILRSLSTQQYLGSGNVPELQENETARIEIRANSKSGRVSLFIDDHIVNAWSDPDFARKARGTGIQFVNPNAAAVKISRIEVTEWDGEETPLPNPRLGRGFGFGMDMDDGKTEKETPPPPEEGRMQLRNGDTMAGEVLAVEDGKILIKTPFREIHLPIESLRSLALKPAPFERCKRMKGDIRAWFPDGSSIVFRLDAVEDGVLTGFSQNFGSAKFRLDAFNRIEFNIYEPALEDIRMATGW